MPWDATGRWIPESDDVGTQLSGLLASNSSYITTARSAGQRAAGRRGLLNSSLAAGAGEAAAIAAGAPLASQNAQQIAAKNQAVLEGGIQYDNQSRLAEQQQGYNMETSRFNQGTQFTLQERDAAAQAERLRLQQAGEQTLAAQQAEFQRQRDLLQQAGATEQQLREFDQRTQEQIRSITGQSDQIKLQQQGALTLQEREAAYQRDRDILGQQNAIGQIQLQQQGQQTLAAQEAEFQRQRDQMLQEGATATQLREFDQRTKEQLENLASQERVAAAGLDSETLRTQIAANSQLSGQYLAAFSTLANDPNIPANVRNAYIGEFQRILQQGQSLINVLPTVTTTWGGTTTGGTATPTPTPTPTPTYNPDLNTAITGGLLSTTAPTTTAPAPTSVSPSDKPADASTDDWNAYLNYASFVKKGEPLMPFEQFRGISNYSLAFT